jgi:hypothetical protein
MGECNTYTGACPRSMSTVRTVPGPRSTNPSTALTTMTIRAARTARDIVSLLLIKPVCLPRTCGCYTRATRLSAVLWSPILQRPELSRDPSRRRDSRGTYDRRSQRCVAHEIPAAFPTLCALGCVGVAALCRVVRHSAHLVRKRIRESNHFDGSVRLLICGLKVRFLRGSPLS